MIRSRCALTHSRPRTCREFHVKTDFNRKSALIHVPRLPCSFVVQGHDSFGASNENVCVMNVVFIRKRTSSVDGGRKSGIETPDGCPSVFRAHLNVETFEVVVLCWSPCPCWNCCCCLGGSFCLGGSLCLDRSLCLGHDSGRGGIKEGVREKECVCEYIHIHNKKNTRKVFLCLWASRMEAGRNSNSSRLV